MKRILLTAAITVATLAAWWGASEVVYRKLFIPNMMIPQETWFFSIFLGGIALVVVGLIAWLIYDAIGPRHD